MKTINKIIIKVGTSALLQGTQKLSQRYMLGLVQQMAVLRNKGLHVILVSSGAVAAGKGLFNACKIDKPVPSKQACASMGQVKLMQAWSDLFSLYDIQVGQVLLTKDNFSKRNRWETGNTLNSLLQHDILPVINENDTVATAESRVGDNDNLAAWVAQLIGADTIVLLTDQEGLYTADPRFNPEAQLISCVPIINEEIYAFAGGTATACGTGGMITKIEAAQRAARSGARTIIAPSARPNVLLDILEGKQIGTLFLEEKILS